MKHFIKREFDYEERKRPSIRLWGTEDSQLPLSFKDCLRGGGVSTVTHAVISVSLGKRGKESQDSVGKPELLFHLVPRTWRETYTAAVNNLSNQGLPLWTHQAITLQRRKSTGLTAFSKHWQSQLRQGDLWLESSQPPPYKNS